jgi:SH3-like domain-containing protein
MPPLRAIPVAFLAALALVAGCSREGRPGRLQLPADGGVAEPGADPASQFVVALTALRREASDQARVKAGGAKASAPNTLALLQRGERVTLLEGGAEWARVRASDGVEGYVRASAIAPAASVQEATVLTTSWAFDRPDLLAVNAKRKLDPGTLLFVRKTKDLFTEVDAGSGPSTWVLTDRVTTLPADVAAAKLLEKARHLARADRKDEAKEVLALLRSQFPDSALVPVLAAELGEVPPGSEAPTGPTGPAGPSAPSGPSLDPAGPSGPSGSRGTP